MMMVLGTFVIIVGLIGFTKLKGDRRQPVAAILMAIGGAGLILGLARVVAGQNSASPFDDPDVVNILGLAGIIAIGTALMVYLTLGFGNQRADYARKAIEPERLANLLNQVSDRAIREAMTEQLRLEAKTRPITQQRFDQIAVEARENLAAAAQLSAIKN